MGGRRRAPHLGRPGLLLQGLRAKQVLRERLPSPEPHRGHARQVGLLGLPFTPSESTFVDIRNFHSRRPLSFGTISPGPTCGLLEAGGARATGDPVPGRGAGTGTATGELQ